MKEMERGKYLAEHRGGGGGRPGERGLKYLSEEGRDDKRKIGFRVSLQLEKW